MLAIQWIGGGNFGKDPKLEEIEWMLHEKTIITSDMEHDPRKKTEDMFTRNVMNVSLFLERFLMKHIMLHTFYMYITFMLHLCLCMLHVSNI